LAEEIIHTPRRHPRLFADGAHLPRPVRPALAYPEVAAIMPAHTNRIASTRTGLIPAPAC
jgi:hypothetical protein